MENIPNPKLEFLPDETAKLLEDFIWDGAHVPAGFVTDGESVPRFLWSWQRPFGRGLRAAIPHDADYRFQTRLRKEADHKFYDRHILLGVGKGKSYTLWLGLRLGGWVTWRKRRKQLLDGETLSDNPKYT